MSNTYSFDYSEWVVLNNDRQNIRIRTNNLANPVILFVHGGPGICDRHSVIHYQSSLAEHFTLVMWDQRGSGKSYHKDTAKAEIHVEDFVNDATELVQYLCDKFHQSSIILAGHSWGTVIGALVVSKIPNLVQAYIAQGQFVIGKEKDCQKLLSGPPENGAYPTYQAMKFQRDCLTRYGGGNYKMRKGIVSSLLIPVLKSPEYSIFDVPGFVSGALHLSDVLWNEIVQYRFDSSITELKVPVLFTTGRHDYNTPAEISYRWYEKLRCPQKKWVWFEDSAHSPCEEEPELWNKAVSDFCLSLDTNTK